MFSFYKGIVWVLCFLYCKGWKDLERGKGERGRKEEEEVTWIVGRGEERRVEIYFGYFCVIVRILIICLGGW